MDTRDTRAGYQLKKEECKINNLLYMGDLKLYVKNSSQIDSSTNSLELLRSLVLISVLY